MIMTLKASGFRRAAPRVLVVEIGNKATPEVEVSIDVECDLLTAEGYQVCRILIPSLCVLPYQGLGAMRNFAVMMARRDRYDWLVLLDNDVLFNGQEVLHRLFSLQADASIPWFDQSAFPNLRRLSMPMYKRDTGVRLLDWSVQSCVVLSGHALSLLGPRPFHEQLIYNEDEYNWAYARDCGVELVQDTGAVVTLTSQPGRLWHASFSKPQFPGLTPPREIDSVPELGQP